MSSVQPPAPYVPPTPAQTAPVEGEAVPAEITRLPPTLATTDRALTLRGEVQAVNQDGSVRIATPRGPIDVKLPEPVPQRGQSVEVQIPAGSPPRTASVTVPQQAQPQPLPNTPTPPPAQNLPNTPAPQPNAPQPQQPSVITTPQQQSVQPTTQPQTPVPTQHNVPVDEIIATPRPNTNIQTPVPAQPGQPQAAPQEPQLSPQGLLSFLKGSLTTLLKSPVANATAPQNPTLTAAQPQTAPLQQRPLQLGQMLRLTVLPATQPVNTGAPATPNIVLPTLTSNVQTVPQAPQTLILLPQQTAAPQTSLIQNAQALATAPAATMTTPQGASLPVPVNPLARLLMPALPATAAPHITPALSGTLPITTQIPTLNAAPQIVLTPEIPPHQPIIATRPGMQIPALTQPMDVRVTAMLPVAPNTAVQSPAMATLLHGTPTTPVMFARVAGQTAQGFPVVELPTFTTAPDGTQKPATTMMVLQFPARAIPASTILRFDILPMAPNTASPAAASFSTLPSLGEAVTWDALDDVIKATGIQPQGQTAATALQAALPKPGGVPFTAPVMMLAAAMKGGDIAQWLGEKGIEAIKTSRRADALAKISGDFAINKSRMDEPAQAGEWKSLSLPMLYGQDVGRIQLYYRSFTGNEGEGQQSGKKNGTRFVMDLSLTRMGPMQIDGFSLGNRLDITLRSEQTLSTAMREQMRIRYSEAVNGIGFAGELNFNANPDHKGWVVMDDASRLRNASA